MGWKDRAEKVEASGWKSRAVPAEAVQDDRGLLSKALDYGARGLDYAGGVGRYAAAGLANIPYSISTGRSLTTRDDLGKVLKGQGPTTAEYMERGGVPEGPSVDLNPFLEGKTSARDAVGFVGDVALDPLTYVGFPGSHVAADTAETLGKKAYKSGFKKIDERLAEQGKKPISDVLLESGAPTGTTKKLSKNMRQVGSEALAKRDELYKQATDLGVTVDLRYPLQETEDLIAKLSSKQSTPRVRKKADELYEILSEFKREGKVDLPTLSSWKSELYESLPANAFVNGKPKGIYARFDKALSSDFRKAIVDAGEKAKPGLGKEIDRLNETVGSVITSKTPTKIQIRRGETPNLVTSVDAAMAGLGGAAALPLKKGADVAKTTYARTNFGKGLINAANTGLLDPAARRAVIDYMSPEKKKR